MAKKDPDFIKKTYYKIMSDSLYRNSIYLMLSTFIMSFFGFIFWMINARLFTTGQVGLATTIISISTLIVSFSLLGLNVGLIRYLPKSKRKNRKINTCFTLIAIVTIIITCLFLLSVKEISPRLLFIKENIILSFIFIIFMVFNSLSSLTDSIFMAYRSTKYILLKNSIFSILKLLFPFMLVSLGAYGIFSSWMIALFFGTLASFFILGSKFGYKPRLSFHDSIIRKIGKYSFGNYVANFIGGLPTLILPILILNRLGAESSAYYYMAMMIANILFIIPQAVSNSLFAEGSHSEKNLKHQIKKSIKIIALFIIPSILFTILIGSDVLLLFGQDYSSEGYKFLSILALSGIFVSINKIFEGIFKVQKRIKEIVFKSIIGGLGILGLSSIFIIFGFGLLGIGYAWIIGQVLITLVYVILSLRKK